MKTISVLIIMFCLSTPTSALAEEKWTVEKIYSYYETHYSPKEMLHFAQKAALYVSGQCKKGKKACDNVIADFSKPSEEWGILDVRHFWVNIMDAETWTIIAHPNPDLQHLVNVIGIGKRIKDHNGKLIAYFAVDGIKRQPKGFFWTKYTTYQRSVSLVKEPMHTLSLWVLIPGTTMTTSVNYPYRAKSTEELDKVADKLNALVEEWSIIEGKVEYLE